MPELNRRHFLKHSAALGAAALAGCSSTNTADSWRPRVASAPRRGPNEEYHVAVIGFHGRGGGHIVEHAMQPNVRVVTLCDVDESVIPKGLDILKGKHKPTPKTETDVRRVLDDKGVDCISIATPNHWHALMAIWGCQAGKDVYVEKPCSHNISEGRRIVQAARKYNCIVQHGTQSRSNGAIREGIKLLHEGVIGDVYMARALCYKKRDSIGIEADQNAPPSGVHYDLWQGPAPARPFNKNRFHYVWHWNWDYGNGDIGNQGAHQMDIARWGLNKTLPIKIQSMGGRYTYKDQGQTPNTMITTFEYEDGTLLVFEVRGRQTNTESEIGIGNLFYGSKGYMALDGNGFKTMIDGKSGPASGKVRGDHMVNFHKAVRSRKVSDLNADIEEGHYSAALSHLANASFRLGRTLTFDPKTETFGSDHEANATLTRQYRSPFVVPEKV